MDRTSDVRPFAVCIEAVTEGELGSAIFAQSEFRICQKKEGLLVVVGRALSLALRLKNKYNGVNQTHIPKNEAISVKL